MKKRLKRLLLALPGFADLCRLLTRRHVRTFLYHRFSRQPGEDPHRLSSDLLARQLTAIVAHHTVWTPADHARALAGNPPGGHCPVVITVDDGYRDFYEVAFPVLRQARIPATLFVTTGFVDGTSWLWWDRLEALLVAAPSQRLELATTKGPLVLELTTREGRTAAWHQVADRCRFLSDDAKETLLGDLARRLAVEPPESPPESHLPVTWDQIREMRRHGVLFGAHTVSHPILSRVPLERAREEIRLSRSRLETELGEPVGWFCYPQGGPADVTPAVRDLVAELGFQGGYVAFQVPALEHDPYALPRYGVGPDWYDFLWVLCGADYLVMRLRQLLGLPVGPGRSYWAGSEVDNRAHTAAAPLFPEESR
jgi:peptidoglycan/xylan/chitin deacetylase (PgdA/CDA1 family)